MEEPVFGTADGGRPIAALLFLLFALRGPPFKKEPPPPQIIDRVTLLLRYEIPPMEPVAPSGDASADAPSEAAVLQSMALLATLQTAADVLSSVTERRAGRDPSAQEPASVAAPYLRAAAEELQQIHMQLLMSLVHARRAAGGGPLEDAARRRVAAAAVRHFGDLMKLQRAGRLLQGTQQRLLSLYPDVSEELIEEARFVQRLCEKLREAEPDVFASYLPLFLEHVLSLTEWLRRELPV